MEKHDFRFDEALIKSFVGKNFNQYKHHRFEYTNTVTLYLGFMIDNVSYEMSNDYKSLDFFGWDHEATVSEIQEKNWESILSTELSTDVVTTYVNEKIKSIQLVNDHYMSYAHGIQNYDWWENRAIIFDFGDHQLSFEKQDCWFSMEIVINKGDNLIDKISDGKFILNDFKQTDQQKIVTEREVHCF